MKIEVDVSKFEAAVRKKIDAAAKATVTQKLGDSMAEAIKTRTRLGFGVDGDRQVRLKALKRTQGSTSPYIKRRARAPDLSSQTTPMRSNLTFTGQLLESIKAKLEGLVIRLFLDGVRTDGLTNEELRGHVEKARPFFKFTKGEKNRFAREIKDLFMKSLARGKK